MKNWLGYISLSLLLLASSSSFALQAICEIGPKYTGYNSAYFEQTWTSTDYLYVGTTGRRTWEITSPWNSGPVGDWGSLAAGGGTAALYVEEPPNDLYEFEGLFEIGYWQTAWFFFVEGSDDCYKLGNVLNNTLVFLTMTPTTAMTGQEVDLDWFTQYADSCTLDGNSVGTTDSAEVIAKPSTAGGHTVQCVGFPGTPGSSTKTLTVNHPTGETSTAMGYGSGVDLTRARFRGTLTPTSTNFAGMRVIERTGGTVIDNCFDPDGMMDEITAIPTPVGEWDIGSSPQNRYLDDDVIGFGTTGIDSYREYSTIPCEITVPQDMDVIAAGGNVNYASHFIVIRIDDDSVTVTRDLVPQYIPYVTPP